MTVHLPIAVRPQVRGECVDGVRPCPWASCRSHLFVEVATARTDTTINDLADLKETCALDVADRGGSTLEDVGDLLGVSRERVRQIEANAFAKLRHRIERDMLDGWATPETRVTEDEGFDFFGQGFKQAVDRAHKRIIPEGERGTQMLRVGKGTGARR